MSMYNRNMSISYKELPVYQQKQRILDMLSCNQVIVVQSPTGSGKTTQLPVILHEAGYSDNGIIAVTQPRRIAALSVSEYISKQLGTAYPGLVGYKMRFEDKTDITTRIKIMTDGILLQEMKLDPWLSKYSVIMIDEAHERSLNIDFVLGLVKRILNERKDLKVIVSSATMNTELFSHYFDDCPIVTIDTVTYPVTVIYDPPVITASTQTATGEEALLYKIENTVYRILQNDDPGDTLIFLPGEKVIKDCIFNLSHAPFGNRLHLIPLYGRLSKEEQERVFEETPKGKKKVVVSTNIAETSVTIPGITSVIDSGLAKMNFYSPRTFTSSLNETAVSKASCNQRKGRAGRTQAGTCYRLYERKDFESRPMYTLEEIFRTDLSEVILRMAELGITDFEQFDFISPPGREGIKGAVETLNMLNALNDDFTLSSTGKMMAQFPLMPRQSRIIVEAIMNYPDVIEEVLVAVSFLSAQSPFLLPPGEEADARQAHHTFRDNYGDFVSYIRIFRKYTNAKDKEKFCKESYLDSRVMAEIANIKVQLEEIVSQSGIPITGGGSWENYLCCICTGLIQFVCVREKRENYKSLTAENIQIHPGSNMFRTDPLFIVAGEIVRTSRMFAMSVSPLTKQILEKLGNNMESRLFGMKKKHGAFTAKELPLFEEQPKKKKDDDSVIIGNKTFRIEKIKGKKTLILPYNSFCEAISLLPDSYLNSYIKQISGLKARIITEISKQKFVLLDGEKLELIMKIAKSINLEPVGLNDWPRKLNIQADKDISLLIDSLKWILRVTVAKQKSKELGFISLYTDGATNYWFKVSRGFSTALNESLSSLEVLIDDAANILSSDDKNRISAIYGKLNNLYI